VIDAGVFHIGLVRQPPTRQHLAHLLEVPILPPLTYPDAAGAYFGYDRPLTDQGEPRSTRLLVTIVAWIAMTLLALKTGRFAGQKGQGMQLCKEYLSDDPRIQVAVAIFETCKVQWSYRLPEGRGDREQLSLWCREVVSIENDYLALSRDYVLAQLLRGGYEEQGQALRILQHVVYPDDAMIAVLTRLLHASDVTVQRGAERALARIPRQRP
jgi:hypothetical protein